FSAAPKGPKQERFWWIEERPPRLDKSRPSEVGLEVEEKPYNDHTFIRRPGGDCPVLHRRWPIHLRRRGDRRSLAAPPGTGRASQAGQPPPRHRHRHRAGRPRRADPIRSARHPGTHPFPSGSDRGAILMAEVLRTPQAERTCRRASNTSTSTTLLLPSIMGPIP